jgi:hypothetical protein
MDHAACWLHAGRPRPIGSTITDQDYSVARNLYSLLVTDRLIGVLKTD